MSSYNNNTNSINNNNEDDDNDHIANHTRNLKKKINYAEIEHSYDFVDSEELLDNNNDDNVDYNAIPTNEHEHNNDNDEKEEDEEEDEVPSTRSGRKTRSVTYHEKDEEDEDDNEEEDYQNTNRKRVNKFEADEYDYHEEEGEGDADDDDYEYGNSSRGKRGRGRGRGRTGASAVSRKRAKNNGYTTSSRSKINDFIDPEDEEDDDDDEEDEYGYSYAKRTRSSRARSSLNNSTGTNKQQPTRSHADSSSQQPLNSRTTRRSRRINRHLNDDEDEEFSHTDEDNSLQKELQELQEDSPVNSPKRFLRERKKNINYVLPLPQDIDNAGDDEYNNSNRLGNYIPTDGTNHLENSQQDSYNRGVSNTASPSGKGAYGARRTNNKYNGPVRRLFATGGPFGGNDVTSIFGGVNAPSYIPTTHRPGLSSLPQNGTVASTTEPTTKLIGTSIDAAQQAPAGMLPPNLSSGLNNLKENDKKNTLILDSDSSDDEIIPFGQSSKKTGNKKNKPANNDVRKPETADVDPLGVDMNIDFDDVGGLDNYIDQLKEMVALPLLYPELYSNFNITPPRGVLFHGPPGTGKTLMARALAASCSKASGKNITFFMRKGADILSKWVGEAERQLRLLFEEAKKHQPSIIFFDEIDGLAPVRSSKQEQIHASIVSTMLALMDGMDNRGQVIVIGATNRPDSVDPALRRPGRFDREFYFPLPDIKGRNKIIHIHTKKWNPPLPEKMIEKLAELTKGYGGADLRSLCTEAALNSIQRRYPQIYQSSSKFKIDPSKVHVSAKDFMLALEKIVPSSARGGSSLQQPLPKNIECLLDHQLKSLEFELEMIIPKDSIQKKHSDSLIKHYIEYDEVDSDEETEGSQDFGFRKDGGFGKQEFLKELKDSRISKPRFLLCGKRGNGQQYIGSALLNFLEGINIQNLDLSVVMNETTKTMESCVVQVFTEARRRQPAVIYIPNFEVWIKTVAPTVVYTLSSLLRSLKTEEKVLLMAITDGELPTEPPSIASLISEFDFETAFELSTPDYEQRLKFFEELKTFIHTRPNKFESSKKRSKPIKKLQKINIPLDDGSTDESGNILTEEQKLQIMLKSFQHQDMKLKNTLKIKLSGLMDLFKNRYKRFRKPPIDDIYLTHLFEPLPQPAEYYQPAYVKDGDMILEVSTGKRLFNMDLDIVEERLWNGFYSEPKQFLQDIEMIYLDANVLGDREKIIKSSEMFANAQVGIEDIATPDFAEQCRETRKRDKLRLKLYVEEQKRQEQLLLTGANPESPAPLESLVEVSTGAGSQVQAQLQRDPNGVVEPPTEAMPTLSSILNPSPEIDTPAQSINSEEKNLAIEVAGDSSLKLENADTVDKTTSTDHPVENVELAPEPTPDFIVDDQLLKECVENLTELSDGWPVQKIQQQYSTIISLIWKHRYSWDRTEAIKAMREVVDSLQKPIN